MWNTNYKVVQARNSGDRTNWINVGVAFKRENKFSLKLDTLPLPNQQGEVWLQLYERMEDEVSEKNVQEEKQEAFHKNSNASKR